MLGLPELLVERRVRVRAAGDMTVAVGRSRRCGTYYDDNLIQSRVASIAQGPPIPPCAPFSFIWFLKGGWRILAARLSPGSGEPSKSSCAERGQDADDAGADDLVAYLQGQPARRSTKDRCPSLRGVARILNFLAGEGHDVAALLQQIERQARGVAAEDSQSCAVNQLIAAPDPSRCSSRATWRSWSCFRSGLRA